jgi:hypothetical protein
MNLRTATAAIVLLASTGAAGADLEHELLVFGSAQLFRTSGAGAPVPESLRDALVTDELAAADILFSVQRGPFRLFGEHLLTNHESDLERFQIGWEPSADTVVWLGRFHQASSVWNHVHHHGQYLQTSITRPAVDEWEDLGGTIPQHFLGLLVESDWHLSGGRGLHTAFGGGLAPFLTDQGLEPFDVLHPDAHKHRFGFQARIAYLPEELGESSAGLLLARNELKWGDPPPPQLANSTHFDQTVIGAFGTYVHEPWQLDAAAYYVETRPDASSSQASYQGYTIGYLQVARNLPHGVDVFVRREDSASTERSSYLALFPDFVAARSSLGLRWDFSRRQAITLQLSATDSLRDSYNEFRLQWSAALL